MSKAHYCMQARERGCQVHKRACSLSGQGSLQGAQCAEALQLACLPEAAGAVGASIGPGVMYQVPPTAIAHPLQGSPSWCK